MEPFAAYFLKSAAWLTGFSLIYFLFLRNERYFLIKRCYLIAGILISFIFPLITFHYRVEIPPPVVNDAVIDPSGSPLSQIQPAVSEKAFNYGYILLVFYLSGLLFLTTRLMMNAYYLLKSVRRANQDRISNAKIIKASGFTGSFSFFNYVFINPSLDETESEIVINHELVHVKQKHWLDLMLAEIIRLFQWINPFAWIYSGFVRQNHEYIADKVVLQQTADPAIYKAVLVNQIFNARILSLSNSFNYSLNKKRFEMMKKSVHSPYRKMKVLLVLPVIAFVFYAFAIPEYHYTTIPESITSGRPVSDLIQKNASGRVVNEDGKPLAGVSIVISNISLGVVTGADGKFAFRGIPDGSSMIFSCEGYRTYIMPPLMTSNMNLYVKLVKDPGYKRELTVRAADGSAGKPLIVKDGIVSDEDISPESIVSVNVLKGQAAIDKYGDKGKDGVIEITTRKDTVKASENKPATVAGYGNQQMRTSQLVVIDGVITDKMFPGAIRELGYNMGISKNLSPKEGVDKYGDKGANGVIEITTRQKALEMGLKPPYPRLAPQDFPTFEGKDHILFNDWVRDRVKYPEEARAKNIEGYVSISFVIEPEGTLSNIKAGAGSDPVLAEEVINVIKTSPEWDPPANTLINEPMTQVVSIGFRLPDEIVRQMPFVVVEEMPMYPGGEKELLNFIKGNTVYPESARASRIEGRVIIRFIVNSEGNAEGATVLKSVDPSLDAEALRVVRLLKGFKPGMQGGKPVDVWYMVPVNFEMTE